MAGSRRFGSLAFGKQTGIFARGGTAATAPLFSLPILDGGVSPTKDQGDLPRIGTTLARLGRFTQRASGAGTVQVLAHPNPLGLLLYEACGAQSVSGVGPTYTHRFTIGDSYPADPLTVWTSVGTTGVAGSVYRFRDSWITRIAIEGSSGENLVVSLDIVSFDYTPLSAIPAVTGTGNETSTAEPRFKYIGSTVQLDADAAAVADVTANSFSFEIDRSPEVRHGNSLTPRRIVPDRLVNFSTNLDYDDAEQAWDFLNTAYVGTPGGTAASQAVGRGAFRVVAGKHPASYGGGLTIVSGGDVAGTPTPQANWEYMLERPTATGDPDTLTYDIPGIVAAPTSGTSEAQIILDNTFAGVY